MQLSDININDHQALFDAIEYNYPSTKEDRIAIKQIMLNEDNPLYIRAMVISALTLNLFKYFDADKYESLYTYTLEDQHITIRARAWVAIVLVAMKHDVRISLDEKIKDQLKFIVDECNESSTKKNILFTIQVILYKCIQAAQAAQLIKDTLGQKIEEGLKVIKNNKEKSEEDQAPAWDNYLNESGIQDQINDLLDLQRKGIDITISTFAQISKFPFFSVKCNWFLPFSDKHPLIEAIGRKSKKKDMFIKIMNKSGQMCSTEKYSNVLVLTLMPDSQMEQVESAFKANDIQIENIATATLEDEVLNYMHDIYRYYCLFKGAKDDYNPFNRSLYFGNYYGLDSVIKKYDIQVQLANYLYQSKIYKDAGMIFKEILLADESKEYLQKYAFCLMNDDNRNANVILAILSRANTLFPGDKWTLKNISKYLENINASQNIIETTLRESYQYFPDDVTIINKLASCLMKQEKFSEALQLLFKSDILKENSNQTMSMIIDCANYLGKKDIADNYQNKLNSANE